jgi:hypothetical protein
MTLCQTGQFHNLNASSSRAKKYTVTGFFGILFESPPQIYITFAKSNQNKKHIIIKQE